jgi:hydrogenase maturation protease
MKTLILGLGNPILNDDGVGNRVAQELEGKLAQRQDVTAMETSMAGLSLNDTRHASSPHDVNFATALKLGKGLGIALPEKIVIYGIEVADINNFSEKCTPEVSKSIPKCVKMIMKELNSNSQAKAVKGSKHFSGN